MKTITLAAAAVLCASALHAKPAALTAGSEWSQDLNFYMFLPFETTGTSGIAGQTAEVDLDLGDVLDVLDFGASLRYEAWRGDFGFIVDGNYYGLSDEVSPGPGPAQIEVDVEQWWLSFLGGYRAASGTLSNGARYSIDLQAGVRYSSLKQDLAITGVAPGLSFGGTETWWEPVIAARYIWEINDRWTGGVLVDAGGFGVNDSDLQWSATIGADYALSERGALKVGLRYYSIDFETERSDGIFVYDVSQVGPFVGYTFRF